MIAQQTSDIVSESIINTIGNTPLVQLNRIFKQNKFSLFGKLEAANPGGSIKDRTSLFILQHRI